VHRGRGTLGGGVRGGQFLDQFGHPAAQRVDLVSPVR